MTPNAWHATPRAGLRFAAIAAMAFSILALSPRAGRAVLEAPADLVPPAAETGTELKPRLIPKFVEPVLQPAILDGIHTTAATPLVIRMSEFQSMVLPASFYAGLSAPYDAGTYVWGYNGTYPGPTIAALRDVPTHVKYVNDLLNASGEPLFLQHTIKLDRTLHWADPLGEGPGEDQYLGPMPAVVHLHGGEVPSAFDGGPDAWWTPGFAQKGHGFVTDQFTYPNGQEATALFYHDHALGATRLNVYAGLAGFYLILDPSNEPADLPGGSADHPVDQYGNPYMQGLAIQDRMFDTNGQLYFPSEGINDEHPYWLPEFFGNVILVNGRSWPYLNVEPRRYRFRFLNGSNARVYEMRLENRAGGTTGPVFWQIGSDGGLLDAPVMLNDPAAPKALRLVMASGERADVVIDFSGHAGQTLTLVNTAKAPYPRGESPNPTTTGVIMQFRVGTTVTGGSDPSLPMTTTTTLRTTPIERFAAPPITRALTLNENMGDGGPLAMFVNNTMWDTDATENLQVGSTEVWEIINLTADTHPIHLHLFQFQLLDRQSFNVSRYMNVYGMPMPGMGPPLDYDLSTDATGFKRGGNPDVTPYLQGPAKGPDPNETGWKDTFRMNPGEVTRVIVRVAPQDALAKAAAAGVTLGPGVNLYGFDPSATQGTTDAFGYPGGPGYVWHCHIVDHEDNEMMRQMFIVNTPPVAMAIAKPGAALDAAVTSSGTIELSAGRPNPAVGRANVVLTLPRRADVDLRLFDVSGKEVRTLANGAFGPGEHSLEWNGLDAAGRPAAPGAYLLRLRSGTTTQVRKLVFLR